MLLLFTAFELLCVLVFKLWQIIPLGLQDYIMKLGKLICVLWSSNNAFLSAVCPAEVIELTDLICCKMSWGLVDGFPIILKPRLYYPGLITVM